MSLLLKRNTQDEPVLLNSNKNKLKLSLNLKKA